MHVLQPNQIKLTNVSIVRLKKGGKRFEIACYKNKVSQSNWSIPAISRILIVSWLWGLVWVQEAREWRTGVETDLSEVLQTDTIFANVSKGQVAPAADLKHSFGANTANDVIVLEILQKGELQVSDKERGQELEVKKKEIAHLVSEKCLDPSTHRPHTLSMIEKAMEAVHFSANLSKSSKIQVEWLNDGDFYSLIFSILCGYIHNLISQALELIKTLSARPDIISLERAQMRVRLTMPAKDGKKLKSQIVPLSTKVEDEEWTNDEWEWVSHLSACLHTTRYWLVNLDYHYLSQLLSQVALIDPGQFRVINEILQQESLGGRGKLETLSFLAEVVEGDEQLWGDDVVDPPSGERGLGSTYLTRDLPCYIGLPRNISLNCFSHCFLRQCGHSHIYT